ncbi:MAG: hypothetical protein GY869_07790 [Planctomycetes bacterium]|nr:hypothetical protein [Planctomycetota bacterium]
MFWGLFFVLFGGLLLLDHWDLYYGGLLSKLFISGLISWGGSIIFDHTQESRTMESNAVGEAEIESTNPSADPAG